MKKGYGVFGKSYKIMNKNDLHDINSIDHRFMQEMILLDESSYDYLYNKEVNYYDMTHHELFEFSKQFKGNSDKETINNVLIFTRNIVKNFNVEFEDMLFGGSEKQIIDRGTDWCADISRVAAVILDCLSITCRILHLANINKAYNGHVLVEAFYENKWGVIDPLYGYLFYKDKPIDAYQLLKNKHYLNGYNDYYKELFNAIAINEYNPIDKTNNYNVSKPNEYYLKLINSFHNDNWIMYENVSFELLKENDKNLEEVIKLHNIDSIKKFISISDNYFDYVTKTENVYYYKVLLEDKLIGGIHIEKYDDKLSLSICIDPLYQNKGYAKYSLNEVLKQFDFKEIEVSIEEDNISSIKLFESVGYKCIRKEDELLIYKKRK